MLLAVAAAVGSLWANLLAFLAHVFWPYDVMIDHDLGQLVLGWATFAALHFGFIVLARFLIMPMLPYRDRPPTLAIAAALLVIGVMLTIDLIAGFGAPSTFSTLDQLWRTWTHPASVLPRLALAIGLLLTALLYIRLTAISGTRLRPSSGKR